MKQAAARWDGQVEDASLANAQRYGTWLPQEPRAPLPGRGPEMTRRRPRLLWVALALTLWVAYIGLAVLAWGDWRGFLAHPTRSSLLVVMALAFAVGLFSGAGGLSRGRREDRRNRWVLLPLILLWLFMIWFCPYADRREIGTLDSEGVRYLGLGLFVGGIFIRLGAVVILRHRFSGLVAIQQDHELVTDRLYRFVRHPAYMGMVLALAGWALIFRSAVGVAASLLVLLPLVARMNAEEALLASEFGDEYRAYQRRTWRMLPFVY